MRTCRREQEDDTDGRVKGRWTVDQCSQAGRTGRARAVFLSGDLLMSLAFVLTGMWQPHYSHRWVAGFDLDPSTASPHLPWALRASAILEAAPGIV